MIKGAASLSHQWPQYKTTNQQQQQNKSMLPKNIWLKEYLPPRWASIFRVSESNWTIGTICRKEGWKLNPEVPVIYIIEETAVPALEMMTGRNTFIYIFIDQYSSDRYTFICTCLCTCMHSNIYMHISLIHVFNCWTYSCFHFRLSKFATDVHMVSVKYCTIN